MKLCKAEATADLSTLLRSGDESFERFSLEWYDEASGAREQMRAILHFAREYAQEFTPGAPNLLLRGGTISIQSESAPTDYKSILVRPL